MEENNSIDAEKGKIIYKGKEFRFLVLPIFVRSHGELKHWLAILDNPDNLREFISNVFYEMEKKRTEENRAAGVQ